MPFKSKAQARAMHAKANKGQISKKTVQEFDDSTDFGSLPEASPGASADHVAIPSGRKRRAPPEE